MNTSAKPLIIFEIANNHMGDISHAKKIINSYSNFIKTFGKIMNFAFKFQHRDLKTYLNSDISPDDERIRRFTSTNLSEKKWNEIIKYTKKKGFITICTPFCEKSVDWVLKKKFDYLKIASCCANEWPLLEYINKKVTKKIICSLGGLELDEINNLISFFQKKDIKYLYCVGIYPSEPKDQNLSYFDFIKDTFKISEISGISTHEDPKEDISGVIGYAKGARIFEKHVNIQSKYEKNKYSCLPNEIEKWLKNLERAIILNGSIIEREKNLKKEKLNLLKFKRGVFLKNGIKKNQVIKQKDILLKFPSENNQILSNDLSKFNSFVSRKNKNKNSYLKKNDVKIINSRNKIYEIREQVRSMIKKSNINIFKNSKLEISYHYGLELFDKFGLCMITLYNSLYCKKLLFLFKNQTHPTQYHKIKKETFFVLYGKIILVSNNKKKMTLKAGDTYTIMPFEKHKFKCVSKNGAVIEELSSESIKSDSFYEDERINLNKDRKSFISI